LKHLKRKTRLERKNIKYHSIVLPKLLKRNWQEWPRNPSAISLAANACSCNSSWI